MGRYTKTECVVGKGTAVLSPKCKAPTPVEVENDLPGTVIVVHGVNDVGTSYEAVEKGLCKGLAKRLAWEARSPYRPARYHMPQAADLNRVEPDPDAVFFKRQLEDDTHSMVIPFYWGNREESGAAIPGSDTWHGQNTDRYGNRLDLDFSKGGGPFANATSTLVDLWNRGAPLFLGAVDSRSKDPLRPVLAGPGRMYMVLAAMRLAALVEMIRDWDANETVSIVAHSQGCLITLLAQAFLLDRKERRTADTLILTHPPYSLAENWLESLLQFGAGLASKKLGGGSDARMSPLYAQIEGSQTLRARLDTLINIVRGVHARESSWSVEDLKRMRESGVHNTKWEAARDRSNRGKVYLYFCPEDMTVALDSVQGIGWQGVPEQASGRQVVKVRDPGFTFVTETVNRLADIVRRPRAELGEGFLQRVFTGKIRLATGDSVRTPFKVGLPPQEFVLRQRGEDDQGHVVPEQTSLRTHLEEEAVDPRREKAAVAAHQGLRYISGEALTVPVEAEMYAGALDVGSLRGATQRVDPIDAAIATTSDYGAELHWMLVPLEGVDRRAIVGDWMNSPAPGTFDGKVHVSPRHRPEAQRILGAQPHGTGRDVVATYLCASRQERWDTFVPDGRVLVRYKESADEIRLRQQQHGLSARSFHDAIIGSERNHEKVTAYDVAVGQGTAVSHPEFYRYLCAVADWRLFEPGRGQRIRAGILTRSKFIEQHGQYWAVEKDTRKELIEGNCTYYSTGTLPAQLPLIDNLPAALIAETTSGISISQKPTNGSFVAS